MKIIDKSADAAIVANMNYVWDGAEVIRSVDGVSGLSKNYFKNGVEISGAASNNGKFFYTKDHLGSVREVVAASGDLQGRYDYSPFGKREILESLEGSFEADFGFTGHHFHKKSGLVLTLYRAYDPNLGRWLSADPLSGNMIKIPLQNKNWDEINDTIFAYNGQGEHLPEWANLYEYVGGIIITKKDKYGLEYGFDPRPASEQELDNLNECGNEALTDFFGSPTFRTAYGAFSYLSSYYEIIAGAAMLPVNPIGGAALMCVGFGFHLSGAVNMGKGASGEGFKNPF